jgi:hypothetical protein
VLCKKLPDLEGIEMKLSELHYIQLLDEARQEILTKGNNTVHYLKEIESRLSAGEEAAKKIVGLEKEVENLQCCGNCKHYTPRGDCRSKHGYAPGHYCDHWTQDGLTRKDRE